MGEKLEYYCSSSEDEKEGSGDEGEEEGNQAKAPAAAAPAPDYSQDMTHWQGNSANTGPKGTLNSPLISFIKNKFSQVLLRTGSDSSNWRSKRDKIKIVRDLNS